MVVTSCSWTRSTHFSSRRIVSSKENSLRLRTKFCNSQLKALKDSILELSQHRWCWWSVWSLTLWAQLMVEAMTTRQWHFLLHKIGFGLFGQEISRSFYWWLYWQTSLLVTNILNSTNFKIYNYWQILLIEKIVGKWIVYCWKIYRRIWLTK